MKYISTLILLSASVTSAFAEDFIITQTNSIQKFTPAQDKENVKDFDIYYAGTDGTRARIGGSDSKYYAKSMTFKAGDGISTTNPSHWNLLGEFNFTLDPTQNEQTIVKNESDSYISNQTKQFVIKAGTTDAVTDATPSAFIDLGTSYWTNYSSVTGSAQRPGFWVEANTRIGTTAENYAHEYAVYFASNSRLNVKNNATLTIEGGTKFEMDTTKNLTAEAGNNPQVEVDAGATLRLEGAKNYVDKSTLFTVNGTLAIGKNASFETTSSALKTTINKLSMEAGSSLIVGNEMEITGQSTIYNMTVKSGATLALNGSVNLIGEGVDTFKINGNLIMADDATLTTNASFQIGKGVVMEVSSLVTSHNNARLIFSGGELILNKENALVATNSKFNGFRIVTTEGGEGGIIRVNASQTLGRIYVNKKNIDIYLCDDKSVTLSADFKSDAGGKFVIHNFDENRIYAIYDFGNALDADPNSLFEAYKTVDGQEELISNLYWNNGWLSAIAPAVPEPAEWAMIFGSIALGFAIYRRRK